MSYVYDYRRGMVMEANQDLAVMYVQKYLDLPEAPLATAIYNDELPLVTVNASYLNEDNDLEVHTLVLVEDWARLNGQPTHFKILAHTLTLVQDIDLNPDGTLPDGAKIIGSSCVLDVNEKYRAGDASDPAIASERKVEL